MNNVNKTLYIPLYGKAYVSRKGIILNDKKAEEIWDAEGFSLKGKSKSKWLAYYMGMRSSVFDEWLLKQMKKNSEAVVLHIGCGMDSRVLRVGTNAHPWYDIDFPNVISERKKYYVEDDTYHMIEADVREENWMSKIPKAKHAIIVMEGVSMYFEPQELKVVLEQISTHFERVNLLLDAYTTMAAKASKYKNPINDVGVTVVYGMDDPKILENGKVTFYKEHEMTPEELVNELEGFERAIFKKLYSGGIARKMYRMYEYRQGESLIYADAE